MHKQRFLFGAWSKESGQPDLLTFAATVEQARRKFGLLEDGRDVLPITYADIQAWGWSDMADVWEKTDPVSNTLCLDIQGRIVRLLA